MEAPVGCTATSQTGDIDECNFVFSCDGLAHFSSCRADGDGTWSCQCGNFFSESKYFEIEGRAGIGACGTIAEVCLGEEGAGATTTCERSESSDGSTCSAHDTCGAAVEVGPAITVRAIQNYSSECVAVGDDGLRPSGFRCTCMGGALHMHSFEVSAPSLEDACGPMVEFCSREQAPAWSGPVTCEDVSATTGTDIGCLLNRRCGNSFEVNQDVSLSNATIRSIACQPQDGGARCECLDDGMSYAFDVKRDVSEIAACRTLSEVCSPEAAIEANGDVSCRTTFQSTEPLFCGAEITCTQPVTSEGVEVTGYGLLAVRCGQSAPGEPWWCACASTETTSETFELGTAPDGVEACAEAASRCPDQVEVFIGMTGGFPQPVPQLP
jgi:hypothetical protein